MDDRIETVCFDCTLQECSYNSGFHYLFHDNFPAKLKNLV